MNLKTVYLRPEVVSYDVRPMIDVICASDPYEYKGNPFMDWGDSGEQTF